MIAIAVNGTHSGRTTMIMMIAPPDIIRVAVHLAGRVTMPPRRQSRMCGPMRGWFSSQCDSRGELRAAAQAANRMKGTVGMTGTNAPMMPSARLSKASAFSIHLIGLERAGGSSSGVFVEGWSGMQRLCRAMLGTMTVREILKMGDPRLLRVAQPVARFDTDEIHLLVSDMFDTMRAADGAGLAAPQIGVDLQLVIFGTDGVNPRYPDAPLVPRTVLLNPVVTPIGTEEEEGWEGCLSVPGLRGLVPRWARIRYTGFDQYGDAIDRTVEGFHARVVQHECDHLIGKLYPMRVRDFTNFGFTEVLFPGLDAGQDD
jgi:peptide deformylase